MDYERENYLRNMQQQQQQEIQHKLQLQQHSEQQKQLQQQQHNQLLQQQQPPPVSLPFDYHHHHHQQQQQYHQYLQQQHTYHLQQQQIQQQQNAATEQIQQQHNEQQQQQHQQLLMQQQQQQQILQQSAPPYMTSGASTIPTAMPNYTDSNKKITATTTTTTALDTLQQQQDHHPGPPPSQIQCYAERTTASAAATTTTYTSNTFPTSQNNLHYTTMQQNNINHTSSYNNSNSNNKTDDTSIPAYNNPYVNLSNNLQNGTENTQLAYNKYFQAYEHPPVAPTHSIVSVNNPQLLATSQTGFTPMPISVPTIEQVTETPTITTSIASLADTPTDSKTIVRSSTPVQSNNEIEQTKDDLKRKNEDESDDTPDLKKMLADKNNLNINLRKNIRDVMDETQLDMNTLAAQREESERLARVAEQQKALREYQRQTAVNRQFARTQNRVISLLQSGKTYAKFTDSNVQESAMCLDLETVEKKQQQQKKKEKDTFKAETESLETSMDDEKSLLSPPSASSSGKTEREGQQPIGDVVTIEDSSSEDDCILLSDDDDEELMDDADDDPHNSGLHVNDSYNVPDELGRVVVNVGHPEGEEDIYVAPQIAKTIKPHQIGGVRFLFDNVIESIRRFKSSSGFGCILAHSMGLGKTLQIVCFCDIFLRHTNSKTVLCVMPINTLQNWVNEFNMWTPRHSDDATHVRPRQFDVFVLNDQHKTLNARAKVILRWAEQGGVLLIGYELFRLLALKIMPQRRRRGQKQLAGDNAGSEAHKSLTDSIYEALVKPGPDLVICDEGHRIKNSHAGISLALKQIRTRRRIVLTGYPLQNNLLEYWCMVDFVRPNYLGTRTEFCNMFERPIQNGQCVDSTPEDIKLMRYRAHVLHSLLVGFVQRRSHTVLQQTLPQKLEYVILTRMTTFQRQLYETFMNDVVRTRTVPNPLKAFSVCCKIWNHPDVLYNFLKRHEHDLDIEIEEGEIVPGTPPTPIGTTLAAGTLTTSIAATSTNVSVESSTSTEVTTPSSVVSATLVEESQTSSSGFSSMTAPTPTPSLATSEQSAAQKPTPNECYEHAKYAAHNAGAAGENANCNGNNYWLEPNLPYYSPYPAVLPNHNSMQQPDYVGIVVKPNGPGNGESIGSSEIVDLDTKEIKTVENDIDMERNTVIKSEATTPTKITENKESTEDAAASKPAEEEIVKPIEREITRWSDGVPYDWALDLMKKYEPDLIENSPKMEVFFCILHQSIDLGDRVLLFSQSLLTLNLIERFLQANHVPGTENYWTRNSSYFRLDGSTNSQEREKLVNEFNSNYNVKLFLISTRAGSLGINLVGANRVVVFDASWNPCHDTQAVYRIYR